MELKEKQQLMFDEAYKAIIKQGRQSTAADGHTCRYRGAGDRKCAFGVFISDKEYEHAMEGLSARQLIFYAVNGDNFKTLSRFEGLSEFANDLQRAHDLPTPNDFIIQYKQQMRVLAHRYNLNTNIMNYE